jgi:hypothetical protein
MEQSKENMSLEEMIRANAELITQHLSGHAGFSLGFDEPSVEWLDGFIERQRTREDFDLDLNAGLSSMIGCFLGEALSARLGGKWQQTEHGLGVIFTDGKAAFPIGSVERQFANGSEGSILSFYRSMVSLSVM